jgi:N-acetylmuramoyl-L-alanine amidase
LRGGPGGWRSEVGAHPIPDDRVEVAVHRNETRQRGWEIFPETQIEAVRETAQTLISHYGLVDILGHDDIAPTRKVDPGPAFPMRWLRGKVMGRNVDESNIMRVMVRRLNIRVRPGVDQPKLPDGPLERGTRVQVSSVEGQWMLVHVLDAEGEPTLTGWVHGDFIA